MRVRVRGSALPHIQTVVARLSARSSRRGVSVERSVERDAGDASSEEVPASSSVLPPVTRATALRERRQGFRVNERRPSFAAYTPADSVFLFSCLTSRCVLHHRERVGARGPSNRPVRRRWCVRACSRACLPLAC